jgi:hypothetical protein
VAACPNLFGSKLCLFFSVLTLLLDIRDLRTQDSGTQTFQIPSPATFPLLLPLQDQEKDQSAPTIGAADRPGAFSAN